MIPMLKHHTNYGFLKLFRFCKEYYNLFIEVEVSNEDMFHKNSTYLHVSRFFYIVNKAVLQLADWHFPV